MSRPKGATPKSQSFAQLDERIAACTACPRLVEWRTAVAAQKRAAFAAWDYWGRGVPGFGDPAARVLVCGLAPAAHGGNRTGRVFTGDRSGDWLYAALHRAGYANQAASVARDDGLVLRDCYVTAVVHCAPPDNRPLPEERQRCIGYLEETLRLLQDLRVIVCLGAFAWSGVLDGLAAMGSPRRPRPRFGHGQETTLGPLVLLASYHPSQRNTFTGTLTQPMFDAIFTRARLLAET